MKSKAQSLIEFAIILLFVTLTAVISLQIIGTKINSSVYRDENMIEEEVQQAQSAEEANCTKMGLKWDKQNGLCEAQ
ncbi:MAG: hypothetical protein MJ180_03890 [Candidatus Gastranaerophilales bacterium]|nr:hypothetical protein [Candidatus Gastranaerophilales bacterium]